MTMCMYHKEDGLSDHRKRSYQEYPAGVGVICMTNRHLARQDYYEQIRRIAASRPLAVIVREKDLPEPEYEALAERVMRICGAYQVPCILHTYVRAAVRLGAGAIHLPLPVLRTMTEAKKKHFRTIGVSIHSLREAEEAQSAGAAYLTASHIYATDCKKGLAPAGISFLEEVCRFAAVPVYALGGIHAGNAVACVKAGAAGVCIMSECMRNEFTADKDQPARDMDENHNREFFDGIHFF